MTDVVEKIGRSVIQHGRSSQRIYLMKSSGTDLPGLVKRLEDLAERNNYSKIFAKIPAFQKDVFLAKGYHVEAVVPGFFRGEEKGFFLGKYFVDERGRETRSELVRDVLKQANNKQGLVSGLGAPDDTCRPLFADDMDQAASLYREVFDSYPFPVHDPDYLRSTMDHIAYYGVWCDGQIVALSSAEMDYASANAEMTDFATRPDFQGKGLASLLLSRMESDMKDRQISTLYTIARAYSHGMNITFAKNGYTFSGTLTNNTQICGHLESMNVWYKLLPVDLGEPE